MKSAIRSAKKVLREFKVPACLINSVNWSELKTEIEIEHHQRDLIETWLEVLELGKNLI